MTTFTDAGFLSEDLKACTVKITHYFTKHPDASPSLQLDILETLILASKVEQRVRNYHQSLVYTGFTLSILRHFTTDEAEIANGLTWETI